MSHKSTQQLVDEIAQLEVEFKKLISSGGCLNKRSKLIRKMAKLRNKL